MLLQVRYLTKFRKALPCSCACEYGGIKSSSDATIGRKRQLQLILAEMQLSSRSEARTKNITFFDCCGKIAPRPPDPDVLCNYAHARMLSAWGSTKLTRSDPSLSTRARVLDRSIDRSSTSRVRMHPCVGGTCHVNRKLADRYAVRLLSELRRVRAKLYSIRYRCRRSGLEEYPIRGTRKMIIGCPIQKVK